MIQQRPQHPNARDLGLTRGEVYTDSTLFGGPTVVSEDEESMQMIDILETRNPADLLVMAEALYMCNRTGRTPEEAERYIQELEQRNRHLYDQVNGMIESLHEAYAENEMTKGLLQAIVSILDCFGEQEGTWFDRHWRQYGVSEEMEAYIKEAYSKMKTLKENQ